MQHAVVEHMIPGRIRLRFRKHRGNAGYFKSLVALVSQHPAVEEVHANPRTGSLLILHTASLEDLARAAVQMGVLSEREYAELQSRSRLRPQSGWKALLAKAPANVPLLFFAGLSAANLVLRGQMAGAASEQFWHAYMMWRRRLPGVAAVLALIGMVQVTRGRLLGSASSLMVYGLMLQNPLVPPE